MLEESGLCRTCCHVVLATEASQRIAGMASAVVAGGKLSIFYFNVCGDYWNLGLEADFLCRFEAWGCGRGATEVRWQAQGPLEHLSAHCCGYRRQGAVYVKSLETAPAPMRLPSAWEARGICIQELDLERPEIASDDEEMRRSDGSFFGTVLPFGGGLPGGEGSAGFLRPEDVAAMGNGELLPVVYYAVTARTSECQAGSVSGVVSADMLLVWDLEVRAGYRGCGLGTELLGRFEALGRKLGAEDAWLHPAAAGLREFALKRGYCLTDAICEKSLASLPETEWEPREGIVFEALRLLCFVSIWRHGTRLAAD